MCFFHSLSYGLLRSFSAVPFVKRHGWAPRAAAVDRPFAFMVSLPTNETWAGSSPVIQALRMTSMFDPVPEIRIAMRGMYT